MNYWPGGYQLRSYWIRWWTGLFHHGWIRHIQWSLTYTRSASQSFTPTREVESEARR